MLIGFYSLKWCRQRDSNPQPIAYKTIALPIVLGRHGCRGEIRTHVSQVMSLMRDHSSTLLYTMVVEP